MTMIAKEMFDNLGFDIQTTHNYALFEYQGHEGCNCGNNECFDMEITFYNRSKTCTVYGDREICGDVLAAINQKFVESRWLDDETTTKE